MDITETDWKVFKKIKQKAVDMFCQQALQDFQHIINDESATYHERYGKLYQQVKSRDKKMAQLFDQGHSRSKAPLQLLGIRSAGLADEELLEQLSDQLLFRTNPEMFS